MMTTLKRVISSALALANYGVYGYDSVEGKPKFVDETGNVYPLLSDGMRDQNLAINGGFDYAQRQANPSNTATYSQTASRVYAADRWGITNENTNVTFRRFDTGASTQANLTSRYYGEFSKTTTTGKMQISQVIEGGNCLHLRGRKVRFQAKLRCSSAKTIRMMLLQLTAAGTLDSIPGYAAGVPSGTFVSAHGANSVDPTFGTALSKITPDTADNATIVNSGLSCVTSTTFQRFGGTFTLPTDFKNLVLVFVTDSQFVAADRLEIGEVGFYDGTEIRDWAERMQVTQFLNCQRTFSKSFNADIGPVTTAGINTGEQKTKKIVAGATAGRFETITYTAFMRIAPAITFYNPAAGNAQARDLTGAVDTTATTAVGVTERQFAVTFTGNAATVAEALIGVHWSADAEL